MKKLHWLGAGLLLWACTAIAGSPRAVLERREASMLLTGSISIAADGTVSGHTLDHLDKLKPGIVELVDGAVAHWRFRPILEQGKAVASISRMSLRLVASRQDPDHYLVRISGAHFWHGSQDELEHENIQKKNLKPPRYPETALRYGVSGTVYLVARLDTDGKVLDVAAEQVNLRVVSDDHGMQIWRASLAKSALEAAKAWEFSAAEPGDGPRSVRIPVVFLMNGVSEPEYGKWESYIPGPRQVVPWLGEVDSATDGPDALVAGGVYELGKDLQLLTPLQAG
jgi:hypothetical protein